MMDDYKIEVKPQFLAELIKIIPPELRVVADYDMEKAGLDYPNISLIQIHSDGTFAKSCRLIFYSAIEKHDFANRYMGATF